MNLYDHYLFGGDRAFLSDTLFPLMKGAARFYLDLLVQAPEGTAVAGCLVTNPSHSPENRYLMGDGEAAYLSYGATMDTQIVQCLFRNCVEAIDILRGDEDTFETGFRRELETALSKLPPPRVSVRTGGLMEWIEDYEEFDPGHRHISHLTGFYPGDLITLSQNPELSKAVRNTLVRRLANNYDGHGWSLGWIANVWARLGEGDRAYESLREIVQTKLYDNLFIDAAGNPQVGDMMGFPAAVAEMLLQSHERVSEDGAAKHVIHLLPALPDVWANGSVEGLRARGGFEVSIEWRNRDLTEALIYSHLGRSCRVKFGAQVKDLETEPGAQYRVGF